jgi:hypothetical protein
MVFPLGSSSGASFFTPMTIDSKVLAGWYIARASASAALASGPQLSGASSGKKFQKPTVLAPWEPGAAPSPAEDLKRRALASGVFLDAKDLDGYSDSKAPQDHKQLFALHQALKKLQAVAGEAADKTTSDFRRDFLARRFTEGLTQIAAYLSTAKFTGIGVAFGEQRAAAESEVSIRRGSDVFRTGALHDGDFDAEVAAFQGQRAFTVTADKLGTEVVVDIDLDEMGATPRNLDNVAAFINGKLDAAGVISRFKRVKIGEPNEHGIVPGTRFGFEITGVSTERLSFSAPASASGALFLAGTSGLSSADLTSAGQLTKLVDIDTGAPSAAFSTRLETIESDAEASGLKITAARAGPDGAIYALAVSDLSTDGGPTLRGDKDVVLVRYDSTGRQVWSRVLGASDSAEGAALAVGADGSVTVAGKITGALAGTIDRGGTDGFATRYDAAGVEQWTHRLGGTSDDSVDALALGADGTVYLAGRTRGGIGGTNGGGTDGFVRALDASGAILWTRQFGDADEERATALAVADDGALLVGSVENGEGFLRKFSVADGVSAPIWEHALGDLDHGSINAIHADDTGIYVTGAARSGFALAGSPAAHAGARDAFVIGLDDGPAPSVRFETFLGSSAEDVARDIVVADGSVYVAGYTDGDLPGGGAVEGVRNAFAAKLDAATGALDWTKEIAGRGGYSEGAALVFDPASSGDLDAFGLPAGELVYQDQLAVTQRTSARPGDSFTISVNGGRKKTIVVDADDTLRDLTFKINSALVLQGSSTLTRASGGDVLKIKPKPGVTIEFGPGAEGGDLLAALGLEAGSVVAPSEDKAVEERKLVALGLTSDLRLSNRTFAEEALKVLDAAMSAVRTAYRDITRDPALDKLLANKPTGQPPAYLLAKIANYQEALARLGG